MVTMESSILIPYDFTEVAMHAVEHAQTLGVGKNVTITLLHIVKNESDIEIEKAKLEEEAKKINEKLGFVPDVIAREGSIFKTINQVAEEIHAHLIIMGTHGIKGFQKLMGSHALKVIVGSKVPYYVVQEAPKVSEVKKVIFPVDYRKENKEMLAWVELVAGFFKTKVYLYSISTKDGAVDPRIKANLVFCKNYLADISVDYELVLSNGGSSLPTESLKYASEIDADFIMIMTTRDIAFHDYVLGANEQQIIANASKIPVLVINPRTDLMKYGYGGF